MVDHDELCSYPLSHLCGVKLMFSLFFIFILYSFYLFVIVFLLLLLLLLLFICYYLFSNTIRPRTNIQKM